MPELTAPTTRLHAAWLEARDEWGPGLHEDGFGLRPFDEVDSAAGFAAFVARLTDESDPAKPVEAVWAHCTYRWIVEGGRVLGGIALRHELNDFVLRAGHIGYGIRPAAASVKTIEHHGGVLDEVRETDLGTVRHYWINL
jgi:predicted acetyltransferase